jgi:hypothetical protein
MKIIGRVIEVGEQLCKVETACIVDSDGSLDKFWFIAKPLLERIGAAEVGVAISFDSENIKDTLANLAVLR